MQGFDPGRDEVWCRSGQLVRLTSLTLVAADEQEAIRLNKDTGLHVSLGEGEKLRRLRTWLD